MEKESNAEIPLQEISSNISNGSVISPEIIDELTHEINNMISFAVSNGLKINMDSKPLINDSSADDIINAYNSICKDIFPATPKSIKYFNKISQLSYKKRHFGQPILIRNLIITSIFFLVIFIITASFHIVNKLEVEAGILNNQGPELLLILAYLGSISGLGVTFYLLQSVTTSIKKMSLVQEDAVYYVSLVVLGIISGFIMSEIFPVDETSTVFNKSALALFGGYSADAVFTILQGIMIKLKDILVPAK